ncbi:hypothetical protein GQ53DRAFT_759772 [Thozetella sp. PMI_491]|nr:hypothetical protein GQ53DRAFT_759772 [Thozetella sp. PMI_491]
MGANFLDLPGEIRNTIYEELLAMPGYICLSFAPPAASRTHVVAHRENTYERWPLSLGILRLNRRIYSEAVQILYGRNKFDSSSSDILKTFLRHIGPRCSGLLRQIRVSLPFGPRFQPALQCSTYSGNNAQISR